MSPREDRRRNVEVPPAGPPDEVDSSQDDPRLAPAVREYLEALEAGRRPNRQEFLAQYPDIAGPLADCLEALEFVHAADPQTEIARARPASPPGLAPGDLAAPLGDFRIVRELGRGGMGVVYEAEQLSLGRRIALKVLPFALTLDPRQLQRFKNEARAAAQLHHSNIVPVYSVGCERGVHFYAMQFIDGHNLAELIHQMRRQKGLDVAGVGPRNGKGTVGDPTTDYPAPPRPPSAPAADTAVDPQAALSTQGDPTGEAFFRQVAGLGVQAAEALEHAHQSGVVHRDVKPGNLLVDRGGQLWITDFGLAQFRTDAAVTETGDLVGTLRYMSPEQALARRGLVDHRTDIYSLGATLYEVLTLEPAFAARDRRELLEQIAFDEPRPPRRLNRSVPADLETIVLKAMAKSVEDRYATAKELADDLRRFLDHRPILARRPTLPQRAAKWSRRHRAVVAAGVVLLLLAAVGLGVSTLLIAREQANTRAANVRLQAANEELRRQQQQTEAAYRAEARQHALADDRLQRARGMLDFVTQVSEQELATIAGAEAVRRKLLEATLDYYQGFIDQSQDDDSLREELAASHLHVADLLGEMGSREGVVENLEKAAHHLGRLADRYPAEAKYRQEYSHVCRNLAQFQQGGRLMLLGQKSVQQELKLSDGQVRQVRQAAERMWQAPNRRGPGAAPGKDVLAVLRPEQARRLAQISLQRRGAHALADPAVARDLGLTEDQKQRIRKILEPGAPGYAAWGRGFGHGKRPAWPNPLEQLRGALGVLTPDQMTKWREMTGEVFRGEVRFPFWGNFGPRPKPGHSMKRSPGAF